MAGPDATVWGPTKLKVGSFDKIGVLVAKEGPAGELLLQSIRWGIFGTGPVAEKFVLALESLSGASVELVVSRTASKAEAFAERHRVPIVRTQYALEPSDPVDIVYIATPPSEHVAHALAAIAAGKGVLIEKPFAASRADAARILEAARAAGVFCMEAMWTRFLPALTKARRLLADGAIGEVRSLWASFAVSQRVEPASSLFSKASGGGALAHRGVYPVSLALDLLGPAQLGAAAARIGETGVDEDVSATLIHSGGAVSHVHAGLRSQADNTLVILGDHGRLAFQGPIYRPTGIVITRSQPRGPEQFRGGLISRLKETSAAQVTRTHLASLLARPRVHAAPYAGNGYGHEALAAMEAMRAGELEHTGMSHADTLATAELLDQIRDSWRTTSRSEGS